MAMSEGKKRVKLAAYQRKNLEEWQEQERRRLKEIEEREQRKKKIKDSRKQQRREAANQKDRDRIAQQSRLRNPVIVKRTPQAIGKAYRIVESSLGPQKLKTSDVLAMEAAGVDVKEEVQKAVDNAVLDAQRQQVLATLGIPKDIVDGSRLPSYSSLSEDELRYVPEEILSLRTDLCESSLRTDCDNTSPPDNSVGGPIGLTLVGLLANLKPSEQQSPNSEQAATVEQP